MNRRRLDPRLVELIEGEYAAEARVRRLEQGLLRPMPDVSSNDRARRHAARRGDVFIRVLLSSTGPPLAELRNALISLDMFDLVELDSRIWTGAVPIKSLSRLSELEGIGYVEAPRLVGPMLLRSLPAISARCVPPPAGTGCLTGRGVVIGIVDYGIDWSLDDFCDADGNTRIAFLWDQGLDAARFGRAPPAGYSMGVEYTAGDIDCARAALAADPCHPFAVVAHDPWQGFDFVGGHGTHVAGIAAGNGATTLGTGASVCGAGSYRGVAPQATIVFVNLHRPSILDDVDRPGGTLSDSEQLAQAVRYCFDRAAALGMPCVVNLSMGFNGSAHDGSSTVERLIDGLVGERPGRAVVIAAGNEAQWTLHMVGEVTAVPHDLVWRMSWGTIPDRSSNEVEIWLDGEGEVSLEVAAPDDARSPCVPLGNNLDWVAPGGEERVRVLSDASPVFTSGSVYYVHVSPKPANAIRPERWRLRLRSTGGARRPFHAWIEKDSARRGLGDDFGAQSRFRALGTPPQRALTTMTTPGTATRAITVANYMHAAPIVDRSCGNLEGFICNSSGRGPTRDGREQPLVAAPGNEICSLNVRLGRLAGVPHVVAKSGTSMAAAHVSAVVALMLESDPTLDWQAIRDALTASAQRPGGPGYDSAWGHGVIDAAIAVASL